MLSLLHLNILSLVFDETQFLSMRLFVVYNDIERDWSLSSPCNL